MKVGVAAGKSQNQEWPFAAFSGCAARPVVKRALRVVCGGVERASCARSRVVLRVWWRRLPLPSLRRELRGMRYHLACHCPRRCRSRDRRTAALSMRMALAAHRVPFAHGPYRLWTTTACAQLLAAGVACNKCQIQKWTFATFSAAVALSVVYCIRSWNTAL